MNRGLLDIFLKMDCANKLNHFLELCSTKTTYKIRHSTTSHNNCVNLNFCAKDMNKFQQAFLGSVRSLKKKVCHDQIFEF